MNQLDLIRDLEDTIDTIDKNIAEFEATLMNMDSHLTLGVKESYYRLLSEYRKDKLEHMKLHAQVCIGFKVNANVKH